MLHVLLVCRCAPKRLAVCLMNRTDTGRRKGLKDGDLEGGNAPSGAAHPAVCWPQVGPDSVGASEGFLGWVAYLGAANAGIPLSIIVKNYGWEVRRPCQTFRHGPG